jgi:hypothetical protein
MQVWKTALQHGQQVVYIGEPLHFGNDPKDWAPMAVWHLSGPERKREFVVVGTGFDVGSDLEYRGTSVGPDGFVWHAFERVTP